ncbi:hypothetical protein GCM10022280_14210 [Sphingomonas swuensis]|uniref:Uncharacterized protein n=1 Tax=Sphingomonas swuensis TaxID=977800 RepID=A0ABP7STK8_9SPHN
MRVAPLLLGLLMAVPASVQAQSAAPAAPQTSKATGEAEKRICRRDEGVGSRLGKRVCLTRAQWADLLTQQANDRNDILGRAEREERDSSPFGDRPQ